MRSLIHLLHFLIAPNLQVNHIIILTLILKVSSLKEAFEEMMARGNLISFVRFPSGGLLLLHHDPYGRFAIFFWLTAAFELYFFIMLERLFESSQNLSTNRSIGLQKIQDTQQKYYCTCPQRNSHNTYYLKDMLQN